MWYASASSIVFRAVRGAEVTFSFALLADRSLGTSRFARPVRVGAACRTEIARNSDCTIAYSNRDADAADTFRRLVG
jgi:hypothetical protein